MDDRASETAPMGVIVVKEPKSVVLFFFGFVFFAALFFFACVLLQAVSWPFLPWAAAALLSLAIVCFFNGVAQIKGYELNFEEGIYSFPGGREADNISDYINPLWWLQKLGMRRGSVEISDITQINWEDIQYYDKSSNKWRVRYEFSVQGVFGSITNKFATKGKRDQIYSVMSQSLNMGDPVIVRE
jgi:hypothetical protein